MAGFNDYLAQLEQSRGLPSGYLSRTRQIESSGGRNLASPLSSARGDFQFIGKTAKAYGVDVNDPYSGARGAADYAADNAKRFQAALGRTPTGADLYGMHQQGPGGYLQLARGEIPSEKALANNGGAGMSASQFLAKLHSKFDGTVVKPGVEPGGAAPQVGPTVANAMAANSPIAGAQGPSLPVAAANPVQPPPATNSGLMGVIDGKSSIGDLLNSKSFAPAAAGVLSALGGGQQQATPRPPVTLPMDPDTDNKPNTALLQLLQRRKMGAMA